MIKPLITGSFMDIQHVNNWDAQYWIDQCREWKDVNWEALVSDMHGIGIDTVMITGSAIWGRPMYPADTENVGLQLPMGSADPLGCIIRSAEKRGMDVYPGLGFFGRCSMCFNTDLSPEHDQWLINIACDILKRYGRYKSLKGFYLSAEMSSIKEGGLFVQDECDELSRFVRNLRSNIGKMPLITSPDNLGIPAQGQMEQLYAQLGQLDIDIFAYQDHAGFGHDYIAAAEGFKAIAPIHRKMHQELWMNCEVFDLIKRPDGRNVCVPGDFGRIGKQLASAAAIADKIVIYQYQGIMNRMTELVNIGSENTDSLYRQYVEYMNNMDQH
jgi:hypothetical protein